MRPNVPWCIGNNAKCFQDIRILVKNVNKRRTKRSKSKGSATARISLSKFYDLSNPMSQDMPVYPGEPKPEFQPIFSIGKDKVNVTRLVMSSHTGTHIDAPKHFIPTSTANAVNDIPLETFIGECVVLDISKRDVGYGITDSDLDEYSGMINQNNGDIILVYTGTSDQWVVDHRIKCIGIDSFSMEKYGFRRGLTSEKLLSNGIGIIQCISSKLKECVGNRMFLVCIPLPLEGVDGSPVRPVLFEIF